MVKKIQRIIPSQVSNMKRKRIQMVKVKPNGDLMRKKAIQKLRIPHSDTDLKKQKEKNKAIAENKFNLQINTMIKSENVTCPICFQILVGSTLTICGHVYCLHCIQNATFAKEQCPLCRQTLDAQSFQISKKMMTLIEHYVLNNSTKDQKSNYTKRVQSFNSIQNKRSLPVDLKKGDFVDFNFNKKWISARVMEKYNALMVVEIVSKKGGRQQINMTLNSRKLAAHRTFTVQPPLKPTYFSPNFDFSQPVLRYIVQAPGYVARPIPRVEANLVVNPSRVQQSNSRWDEFNEIEQNNNWMFQDNFNNSNNNLWNILSEDNQLSLFV